MEACQKSLEELMVKLEDYIPCCEPYNGVGKCVKYPQEKVYCREIKATHDEHRTNVDVISDKDWFFRRWFNVGYRDKWKGEHKPAIVVDKDLNIRYYYRVQVKLQAFLQSKFFIKLMQPSETKNVFRFLKKKKAFYNRKRRHGYNSP